MKERVCIVCGAKTDSLDLHVFTEHPQHFDGYEKLKIGVASRGQPPTLRKLTRLYGKRCMKCGSSENLTIDHVVPKALGGSNRLFNYQVLCRECNGKKGATTVDYRGVMEKVGRSV